MTPRTRCIALALALATTGSVPVAQEKVTLTAPVYQSSGATDFRVESIYVKRAHPDAEAEIRAIFREVAGSVFVADGKALTCRYEGTTAETLIVALNKANLNSQSLERRILARCQQDGKVGAGAIVGTPQ